MAWLWRSGCRALYTDIEYECHLSCLQAGAAEREPGSRVKHGPGVVARLLLLEPNTQGKQTLDESKPPQRRVHAHAYVGRRQPNTAMESYNLKTASTYINNLLLSRGLLRNGKPIEFAHPSRGEGGKEATMAQIINLIHDLILKRDVCWP